MKINYIAKIVDTDEDKVIVEVSSSTLEGLEEEMGKRKFTGAVEAYENYLKAQEDLIVGVGDEKLPF